MLTLSAILLVAACSFAGGSEFRVVLHREGGDIEPLPVTLTDTTGTVVGLEPADPDAVHWEGEAAELPGEPNAIVASWLGGACDHRVSLRLEQRAGSPWLIGTTDRANACILVGIGRAVVIRFITPVDPSRFTIAIDQELDPQE